MHLPFQSHPDAANLCLYTNIGTVENGEEIRA
jgi:hypothetical protein